MNVEINVREYLGKRKKEYDEGVQKMKGASRHLGFMERGTDEPDVSFFKRK